MTIVLKLVVCMALVTWLTLMVASLIRVRGWTWPGLQLAFGNRDQLPEADGLAGRAERTAHNTLENFALFAAIALVAHLAAPSSAQVALGAQVFFWSRVLYIPVYYAGIAYLRTAVWAVGIVGLAMMVLAVL